MSRALTWCRRKAEVVSGGRRFPNFSAEMTIRVIFAAND
jgi:hypothetical protein